MANESHIESWTAEEVLAFLTSLKLEQYEDDFLENEITGDILVHLDHEALSDIGVESVGHRLTLLREVYKIKIADNVTIEPEHYVPPTMGVDSAENVSGSEIAKELRIITQAIQARDEKLAAAEAEIKRLTENLTRLKDQLSPVFKIIKEMQPLPNPEPTTPMSYQSQQSLSRKFSTKKLFLGSAPKQSSPTHTPQGYSYDLDSPHSPNRYQDSAPAGRSASSHHHGLTTLPEVSPITSNPSNSRLPPPPRPPPPGVTPLNTKKELRSDQLEPSPSASATPSSNGLDAFKSFRVGLDDPCSKVLPAALKKYKINSDWREYSLFICYADQERCLGLDEKPLLVFQELQRANKSPVFMLRKQESGTTNVLPVRGSDQEMRF